MQRLNETGIDRDNEEMRTTNPFLESGKAAKMLTPVKTNFKIDSFSSNMFWQALWINRIQ